MHIRAACSRGLPGSVVLADASYGNDPVVREGLDGLGLKYMVGVKSHTGVWAPGRGPLPAKTPGARGRKPTRLRHGPGHEPMSVKALALSLKAKAYRKVSCREGTNETLSSRFAAMRVHVAHRDFKRSEVRPEQWLPILGVALCLKMLSNDTVRRGYGDILWRSWRPPEQ